MAARRKPSALPKSTTAPKRRTKAQKDALATEASMPSTDEAELVPETHDTANTAPQVPPEQLTRDARIAEMLALFRDSKLPVATLRGVNALKIPTDIEVISTGSLGLDLALGIGGYPRGRIVELFGAESSGKTTMALHAIAEAQKLGHICAFIDVEHALDPTYAEALGVDLTQLLVTQPDSGEQALNMVGTFAASGVSLIVIDSVSALTPQAELTGEIGDQHVGLQARMMSQALRMLSGKVFANNTIVLFINQIRMKIGVMFGSPKTTSGGQALKFYSSVRIEISRIGQLKKGDSVFGNAVKANVIKNKLAPPFRTCNFDIIFGQGVSKVGEILDIGLAANLVRKSGAWYYYGDITLGQGRENAAATLKQNEELAQSLWTAAHERVLHA